MWNNSGFNAYPAGSHRKGVANSFALKELEKPGCSTEGLRLRTRLEPLADDGY